MTLSIPARRYLTWAETMARLKCDSSALCELVITRAIVPSMFFRSKLIQGWWDSYVDLDTGEDCMEFMADQVLGRSEFVHRFLFLRSVEETGALTCQFLTLCDKARARANEPDTKWFEPPRLITLDDIERKGVFMLEEIERAEACGRACATAIGQGEVAIASATTAPLESREQRQCRRLDRYQESGADRVPNGKGWRATGTYGALARLAREEAAAGRPYSDARDVAKDLNEEAARRRGRGALKSPWAFSK